MSFKRIALWVGIAALGLLGALLFKWQSAKTKLKAVQEKLRQSIEREHALAEKVKRDRAYQAEQERLKVEHDLRALEAKRRIEEIHAKHDAEVLAQAGAEKKAVESGSGVDLVLARREKRKKRAERAKGGGT